MTANSRSGTCLGPAWPCPPALCDFAGCDEPHPPRAFCPPMGIFLSPKDSDPWASPFPPTRREEPGRDRHGTGGGGRRTVSLACSQPQMALPHFLLCPRAFAQAADPDTPPPHDSLRLIPSRLAPGPRPPRAPSFPYWEIGSCGSLGASPLLPLGPCVPRERDQPVPFLGRPPRAVGTQQT